jgi:hypothetical protein
MNVEIGKEAAQFPEKEYINGIFLVVQCPVMSEYILGYVTEQTFNIVFSSVFKGIYAQNDMIWLQERNSHRF